MKKFTFNVDVNVSDRYTVDVEAETHSEAKELLRNVLKKRDPDDLFSGQESDRYVNIDAKYIGSDKGAQMTITEEDIDGGHRRPWPPSDVEMDMPL